MDSFQDYAEYMHNRKKINRNIGKKSFEKALFSLCLQYLYLKDMGRQ